MNTQADRRFPSIDTVLNAAMIDGMALSCALLVGVQGVQALVA